MGLTGLERSYQNRWKYQRFNAKQKALLLWAYEESASVGGEDTSEMLVLAC